MCIIIAEAGENHLGDMKIAKKMIDISAEANCDYVKFQYYDAAGCSDTDPEKEWFYKVQLDLKKIKMLYKYCQNKKIKFLCTPWDADKAEQLFSLGIKDMKIASFHITDYDMLTLIKEKAEKVFLSTGMSSLKEIEKAVKILKNTELYLLHCVSEYPLKEERVNLKTMNLLKKKFKCRVGYSDHTLNILAPLTAIAAGAEVIEKHITFDKTFPGTDHILSAGPFELRLLVEYKNRILSILGEEKKILTEIEQQNQNFLRNRFRHNRG